MKFLAHDYRHIFDIVVAVEHVACLYAAAKFDDAKASLQATFASVPAAYVDGLLKAGVVLKTGTTFNLSNKLDQNGGTYLT